MALSEKAPYPGSVPEKAKPMAESRISPENLQ